MASTLGRPSIGRRASMSSKGDRGGEAASVRLGGVKYVASALGRPSIGRRASMSSKGDGGGEAASVRLGGVKYVASTSGRPSIVRRASTSSIGVARGGITRQDSYFWKAGMPRCVDGSVGERVYWRVDHESRSGFGGGICRDLGGTTIYTSYSVIAWVRLVVLLVLVLVCRPW